MITPGHTMRDSATMLIRDLRHAQRYPLMSLSSLFVPVFYLLLFVGIFGGALGSSLGASSPLLGHYVEYVAPAIILITACSSAETTAVLVCTDMSEGIIARFRTMAIARASVLSGQVLGGAIRTLISGVVVVAVAFAFGYRPAAGPVEWVAAAGLFVLVSLALTWFTVALGLLAKTPAGANSLALIIVVLPFLSSAFVPIASMPAGVRWFAQNQPFTPIIDTLRGLLANRPLGSTALLAVAWCVAIAAVGYLWSRALYNRTPAR